jgi:hypothetical protein
MKTFREWLKEYDEQKSNNSDNYGKYIIDFNNFFEEELSESVINKIKKLYFLKDAVSIVKEFKNIFSIDDEIKISKVSIGGKINVDTKEIEYSSLGALIHELVHYLQLRAGTTGDMHIKPHFTNCGILNYIVQPLELNNWSLSLAAESLQYDSFEKFLKTAELLPKSKEFLKADRHDRLKHCLYLLTNNMNCGVPRKYKDRLLTKAKQYMLAIKSLEKDITEHYTEYPTDSYIDFI